ncbi:hypothetical protein Patl1_03562 [Pistacia atlantica]|uniref:Uncharacterized protein n=1 Tax=Pistacia atlantica TaxID=434234 RepID=A0ACC1C8F1_9ROSI|nr:hypothetical protein Patl1_03562 [Pistacia atlantica]
MKTDVLAKTEDEILPVSEVLNVIKCQLPVESTCINIVISSCRSLEFPPDKFFEEISRVLKPGGITVVYKNIKCDKEDAAKIDDDYDLIDEEALLTEEDLKKPQLPSISDCEVGSTRKACKNCTCGRAEAEEIVQKLGLSMDQLNNPQSACGNCGLGDAFRRGTCPYKVLPPVILGEKKHTTHADSTAWKLSQGRHLKQKIGDGKNMERVCHVIQLPKLSWNAFVQDLFRSSLFTLEYLYDK